LDLNGAVRETYYSVWAMSPVEVGISDAVNDDSASGLAPAGHPSADLQDLFATGINASSALYIR